MKKTIVFYYSKNGSNNFLAHRIARDLNCPIEEIKPIWNFHLLLLLGIHPGNKKTKAKLEDYDRIILVGPIWWGKVIAPLKSFIDQNREKVNDWVFTTCCASSYEKKDEKFGLGHVFAKVRELLGEKCSQCEAFSVTLLLPEEQREDAQLVMNTRLSEQNFKGAILQRYNAYLEGLRA